MLFQKKSNRKGELKIDVPSKTVLDDKIKPNISIITLNVCTGSDSGWARIFN
jgi:hypothetical protein